MTERIEQEGAIASRNQRAFALMVIDIEAFKQVNDSHGREVGDQGLIKIAALLRQSARVEDVVGPFGGEEFVVVYPGANLAMGSDSQNGRVRMWGSRLSRRAASRCRP